MAFVAVGTCTGSPQSCQQPKAREVAGWPRRIGGAGSQRSIPNPTPQCFQREPWFLFLLYLWSAADRMHLQESHSLNLHRSFPFHPPALVAAGHPMAREGVQGLIVCTSALRLPPPLVVDLGLCMVTRFGDELSGNQPAPWQACLCCILAGVGH